MIRPNTSLSGRYRLESKIAVGGMGEVWQATDEVLDRPVAVKLLHQAGDEQYADAAARFRAEARYVGSLSHSGIAQVYDYGEADRDHPPYLVMELVGGPSLAGLLAGGPLSSARTMDIIAQAADALHEAHAAGLVHRDIKPGNLLIGPGDQVKIVDFGIAQATEPAAVTGTGAVLGSPAYLAPERIRGSAATPASDLYSLGIVAYECLAGTPPFSGAGLATAHAHVHQPMPPLPVDIPAELVPFVERLTAKDPAARPASAAEVAARARSLRDLLGGSQTLRMPALHPDWKSYSSASGRSPDGSFPGHRFTDGRSPDDHYPNDRYPADPVVGASGPGQYQTAANDDPSVGDPSWPDHPARGLRRSGLVTTLAAVVLVVLAGLAGWQLKGLFGTGQGRQANNSPATTAPPSRPAAGTVMVAAATLDGQNARDVRHQLRKLGLRPRLVWQPADHHRPGTVLSVAPSGLVQPGSVVVVTVVAWRQDQGRDGGGGDGGGHGGGGSGDAYFPGRRPRSRTQGGHGRAEADVTAAADLTITQAHDIAHHAEAHLLRYVSRLAAATIHAIPAGAH